MRYTQIEREVNCVCFVTEAYAIYSHQIRKRRKCARRVIILRGGGLIMIINNKRFRIIFGARKGPSAGARCVKIDFFFIQ